MDENPVGVVADLYVAIPAYNEESVVVRVVGEVRDCLPNAKVVVVDDGSSDETGSSARKVGATVLRHVLNRGQGASLETAIEYCRRRGARVIVTFDADGQHMAEDIVAVVEPILRGEADVVLGSRFLGEAIGISPSRKWLLKTATLFTRLVSGIKVTDAHNGFRALSAEAARRIEIRQDRMAHASEILDEIRRHELRFVEVPVRVHYSRYSKTKGQSAFGAFSIVVDYVLGRWKK